MPLAYTGAGLRPVVIGVDVGGTKVMAAEIAPDGEVLSVAHASTPGRRVEVELVEAALTQAVTEVAAGRRVAGVGLAAAGFVDSTGERVMFAPHLPWRGHQVRARLAERWQVPVFLDNDANCAARAETDYGAAVGAHDALVITLGTGIGGAVVLDGVLHRGRNGMAGEFGHAQVVPGGRECECGGRGCWEQYCSGNALVRHVRAALADGGAAPALLGLADGDAEAVTGPMITEAARLGDPVSLAAFAAVGEWLGIGVANLVAAYDPEVVVIGGGVSAAEDLLLGPARTALADSLVGAADRVVPPVLRASFGPEAGVVGAASMVREGLGRGARPRRGVRLGGPAAPAPRVRASSRRPRDRAARGASSRRGR
ncbi:ROK family protein [Nocardioides bruguierae]|uniref:ROK family protein n=1 Tax=Nocardioides bruguierae TaxID=2945102 RepID=A0A9X2D9A8_9ACTN|nr:ROK family protein [Nocardioides bruguierae]MCL8027030.1 ROK family protein [Nocardioides bruguierae]MCM0621657.1 ROK family protein [Nocardioides bruguierae]